MANGWFSYTNKTQVVDIGVVHLGVARQQQGDIPLWAGVGAIARGLLPLFSSRKSGAL